MKRFVEGVDRSQSTLFPDQPVTFVIPADVFFEGERIMVDFSGVSHRETT